MGDWSKPTATSNYLTEVLPSLDARLNDAAEMFFSLPSNPPTNAIRLVRLGSNLVKFQQYDGAIWTDQILDLTGGGTGAVTASGARTNLGLGTMATENANTVVITGGSIFGTSIDNTNSIDAGAINSGTINAARLPTIFNPGMMMMYGGSSAPSGWQLCDGSALNRTTFAALFTAIGTAFGAGDGSTTFNVPDLRQRFPLGKAAAGTGSTLGSSGGSIDHTHTSAAHTHTVPGLSVPGLSVPALSYSGTTSTDGSHGHSINFASGTENADVDVQSGSGTTVAAPSHFHGVIGSTDVLGAHNHTYSGNTGTGTTGTGTTGTGTSGSTTPGTTGSNNPPYQVVNFIIKT
jgi:microcystin-dependent protein